jgi:hypothetical protein
MRYAAAIDWQSVAGDERGSIGAQPYNRVGHFFGRTDAADRVHVYDLIPHFAEAALRHVGVDDRGTDGVDANAGAGIFNGGGFGEADYSMFGGGEPTAPPTRPAIEDMFTMVPLPCFRICCSSYFMDRNTPVRLMAMISFQVVSE